MKTFTHPRADRAARHHHRIRRWHRTNRAIVGPPLDSLGEAAHAPTPKRENYSLRR